MGNAKKHVAARSRRGFTLVEMMVAVALMTIIVAIAAKVFQETSEVFSITRGRVEIYQNARAVLDKLETELRMAFLDASGERFVAFNDSHPGSLPTTRMSGTDSIWFNTMAEFVDASGVKYRSQQCFYYLDTDLVLRKFSKGDLGAGPLDTADELGFYVWNFQLQYFDTVNNNTGVSTWNAQINNKLPAAVRVTLCVSDSEYRQKQTLVRIIAIG